MIGGLRVENWRIWSMMGDVDEMLNSSVRDFMGIVAIDGDGFDGRLKEFGEKVIRDELVFGPEIFDGLTIYYSSGELSVNRRASVIGKVEDGRRIEGLAGWFEKQGVEAWRRYEEGPESFCR